MIDDTRRPAGPATIVDVARAAGVSHSTVSRMLNDHPHISAATRERVQAALDSLGYVANLRARGLAGGRLGVVGLVVLDLESAYTTEIVRAVDAALADAGVDLMLCATHRREQREASYVRRLSVGLVDGLIVLLPRDAERYTAELAGRNFNFVLLDHAGLPNASAVAPDNRLGTKLALDHLRELGHTRIACITGDLEIDSGQERLAAFREYGAEHGLDGDPDLVVTGDFLEGTGHDAMLDLLDLPDPPTAVFASADTAAFGAITALRERGVSAPEEMSVVGFDDIAEARLSTPALTTVHQPLGEIGRRAVQLLLDRFEEPDRTAAHVRLPVELIVRESTAPPPSS